MPRKLEEVKKEINELKENTSLSVKEIESKYNLLDKELDDLLSDKIKFSDENSFGNKQEFNKRNIGSSFYLNLGIKNMC